MSALRLDVGAHSQPLSTQALRSASAWPTRSRRTAGAAVPLSDSQVSGADIRGTTGRRDCTALRTAHDAAAGPLSIVVVSPLEGGQHRRWRVGYFRR